VTNARKHVTQMTRDECIAVEMYAHTLPDYTYDRNPHVVQRMAEKRISYAELLLALRKGTVIECHANNYPEIRYVLRYQSGNRAICVCASHRGNVVTVWANNASDHHKSLDASQYQWKADLTRVFDTLKG
jgi:hypothetical protein